MLHPDWEKWTPEERERYLTKISADCVRMQDQMHPVAKWGLALFFVGVVMLGIVTVTPIAVIGGIICILAVICS